MLQPQTMFTRGLRHVEAGNLEIAIGWFRRTIAADAGFVGAELNLALALMELQRFYEALPHLQSVAARHSEYVSHHNLAICLYRLGRFDEAEAAFRAALIFAPDNAVMQYGLAFNLLSQGKYEEGWRHMQWRKQTPRWAAREPYPGTPTWGGEALPDDASLVIFHEQGFGDTLMLARYLSQVQDRVPQVRLVCPTELRRLLHTSFNIPLHDPDVRPIYQCSLYDLPSIFGITAQNIPTASYLRPRADDAARWARRITTPKLRVGLVWAGGHWQGSPTNSRRSLQLAQLSPLFEVSGSEFVSLQVGEGRDTPGMENWTAELRDFADTAALIQNLDLVIAVDTAVFHLTAAMGRPVWLLNRFDACWPHLRNAPIPWYGANVREFRQPAWGDWQTVIDRVRIELSILAHAHRIRDARRVTPGGGAVI